MLVWFIPLLVFVIFIIQAIREWDGTLIIYGGLATIPSLLIVLLAGLICIGLAPQTITETETCEIHALVDNIEYEEHVSGNVFLIRAYTEEELQYNYMYMVEGKGFAFNSVEAKSCYLNKTSDIPYVVLNHYDCSNEIINFLFGRHWTCYEEYIFYLPQDAEIIDDFAVDLQ